MKAFLKKNFPFDDKPLFDDDTIVEFAKSEPISGISFKKMTAKEALAMTEDEKKPYRMNLVFESVMDNNFETNTIACIYSKDEPKAL